MVAWTIQARVAGLRRSLTHLRVRSIASSPVALA
jgi:hypothetical protein